MSAEPSRARTRAHTTRALAMLLVTMSVVAGDLRGQADRPTTLAGRSTVYAPSGAVATSHPLATSAALSVLQAGGSAADAAVAAAAVLNVVEPHMTGMGGDMFALLWSAAEERLVGLESVGAAGSLMTREALLERGHESVPVRGVEAVTVPGALAGWAALIERYGRLTLGDVLAPAIQVAEGGFPVSPIIAREWSETAEVLARDPGAAATYLVDGERGPEAGEWFRNPDLAATLRQIATQGPAAFYGGELGRRIVDHTRQAGGFLTLEDLAAHEARWVEPVSVPFRGYRLWQMPPPGQGIAALQMLRILDGFDLGAMEHNSAEYLHHLIEAKKLAFADLAAYVADPDHMTVTPERLLSDDYIQARRGALDPNRAAARPGPGPAVTDSETIYLSVADADGNMVSFINSTFYAFGSGVVVPGTGFALQNRGTGFSMEPGHPNQVAPGKRPFHTIIPAFVTRTTAAGEEPWLSYGVMGGAMQPQGHVQVLLNLLVFGMDLQQAVDAPRFRHLNGQRVALEAPIGDAVRAGLTRLGHDVLGPEGTAFGGAQAVKRLPTGWAAASDPRKDGHAGGH
jgi:gamma-glutamyltranspeptidase / glutathione hydrolase